MALAAPPPFCLPRSAAVGPMSPPADLLFKMMFFRFTLGREQTRGHPSENGAFHIRVFGFEPDCWRTRQRSGVW